MGINGLLPLLKSIQKPCNLKKFAGQTIGVDAYGWLHRGTVACAIDLALGKPTTKHIDYSVHRVRMLLHFGVKPYIVFDGDYLPSKAKTEVERAKRREESKQRGLELYRLNKPSQAHLELQKAVDVTPEMARQFIEELKRLKVDYVVAPYEADAQLVYLEKQEKIDGILSEDSDLLVFGAKRLLTKLDQYGDCIEVNRADFTSCKDISLVGWTDAEFRRMAILSGCDYLASINRMGLKTAYRLVRKHKTIEKIIRSLQFDGQYHVPAGYLEAFNRAELTFLHQWVFCVAAEDLVMLTDPEHPLELQNMSFIGDKVEKQVAIGVSVGDLDPMTKAPIRVHSSQISTSPVTPWANARKSIVGENLSSMKGNQSIESFFKSKRTPLAELNVNTFTPSPSQARVLRQNEGAIWNAVSAVAQASSFETTTAMPGSLRTPLSDRGPNSSNLSTAKKRKLLSNKEIFVDPDDLQGTSSKFFTANTPGNGLRGRNKSRKKATDFTVWSDDSVENAMIELAADTNATGPQTESKCEESGEVMKSSYNSSKKETCSEVKGYEDSQSTHDSAADTQTESQTNITANSSIYSARSSNGACKDERKDGPVEHSDRNATSTNEVSQDVQDSSSERETGINSSNDLSRNALTKQQSLTALQRLGMGALGRSKSYTALSSTAVTRVDSFKTLLHNPSNRRSGEETQQQPSMPLAYTFGPDATMAKGSEDALIPDSEGEGSDALSESEEELSRPAIDFGRFAFSG